jgi:Bacterial PH domain
LTLVKVIVLKRLFLVLGTLGTAVGVYLLLFSGLFSSLLSNSVSVAYVRTLLGLVPGVVFVAAGAWTLFRAWSRIRIPKDLKDMMGPNEKVQLYVKQTNFRPRPFGVDSWLMTNERVIQRHPHGLKLNNDYTDRSYAEIKTLNVHQGIFRSTIRFDLKEPPNNPETNLNVSPSDMASAKGRKTLGRDVRDLEFDFGEHIALTKLAKSDARKADGIIRENIVRFQTPFFQTPFPSDKIAYDSTQKNP